MPEWRMLVWQPDGTVRPTIDVDGPVARLDRFDVNGAGNCLEAAWTADPQAVTIKARDIIRLDAREDSGDAWTSVYKGFVTIAGSSRAESLQDYRAVGLKQRLYEVICAARFIDGGDVASIVNTAVQNTSLPAGVTYSSTDVPTLNFELGNRYPRGETLGDLLDELVATVGRFFVPVGETYTYDGVTYDPGEIVPGTKWGVDADGALFFRRPQATPVSVSEGGQGVHVRWERASGEEVYDRVKLIYASKYEPWSTASQSPSSNFPAAEDDDIVGHPISALFGLGSTYGSTRRVPLTNPIDYMTDEATQGSATDPNITNPGNAFDGDTSTHAELPNNNAVSSLIGEAPTSSGGAGGVIVRVVFEKATSDDPLRISLRTDDGTLFRSSLVYDFTDQDTAKRTVILPALVPAAVIADGIDEISVSVTSLDSQGTKVYALQMFAPDSVLGEKIQRAYRTSVEDNASAVELVGQLGSVSQTMSLTPVNEAAEDVPIKRIETSLTNDRGLVTRYMLGQSFEAELLSEAIVLQRLARKQSRGTQQ